MSRVLNFFCRNMRVAWVRRRGARIEGGCTLGARVAIIGPADRIHIGAEVSVERDTTFTVSRAAHAANASITIGDRTLIGAGTFITAHGPLRIGSDVLIAARCYITEASHGLKRTGPMRDQDQTWAPVVIEDDVWIGTGAVITPGVTVHRGAVVGANSVVTRDVPPFAMVAGAPARVIGERPE